MLEIIFNRKCTEKCDVKVIGLAEKQSFCDSAFVKFWTKRSAGFCIRRLRPKILRAKAAPGLTAIPPKGD